MAKNQLLPSLGRMLILLQCILLIALSSKGSNSALNNSIALNGSITLNEKSANEAQTNNPMLRVFVSSSMSISLLKEYAKEAKQYNAVLVFRGLPGGSFKELSKLILSLKDKDTHDDELGAVQIDDEAFERFNVASVPTIVLSQDNDDPNCNKASATCNLIYDKVEGNIEIREALKKFAEEGDMREAATKLMRKVNDKALDEDVDEDVDEAVIKEGL